MIEASRIVTCIAECRERRMPSRLKGKMLGTVSSTEVSFPALI